MPSILGHPVLRREDPRFLTGWGAYVANLVPPEAAPVAYATSTEPHARLLAPDVGGSFRAKGLGESGTVGATAAAQNAVVDALAPFGIRHLDMPLTPERVWKAVQNHG